ncbi:MAG: FG-GAP-like repeat-containing protein [Bacteroidetes bacterium]|nr:FG-GAP-like repeat-containing protein [Bacteroidota bacterium]
MKAGKKVFALGFTVVVVFLSGPSSLMMKKQAVADSTASTRSISASPVSDSDYEVQPNPDVNPVLGFTVISDSNLLAYTRTSITHSDGKHWNVLYRAEDRQIGCMSSDGKYVIFSPELVRFGATMTIAPLYAGVLAKHGASYRLSRLTAFKIPLGHSLVDIRFTGRGEGFLTTIFEYAYFKITENQNGKLEARFTQHILPIGSNSGGGVFGSSPNQKEFPVIAVNEGAIVEASNEALRISPLIDIYKTGVKTFELDEGLISCTMFDSSTIFFLSSKRLFIASRTDAGAYKVIEDSAIKIRTRSPYGAGAIPVDEICSLLAMNDSDVFALTMTGSLLKGEYSKKRGTISDWQVAAILPLYNRGILARLNQNTILIGGTSVVKYFVGARGWPTAVAPRDREFLRTARFSVVMFDAGTTYGVGIGKFDRSLPIPYVYLVELSGQNRLYLSQDGATFPGNTFDMADQHGVTGRSVENKLYKSNFGLSVAIGDINEDGSDDIIDSYLSGPPVVLVNNGRGYFRDETSESGLDTDLMRSECVTLADVNNDGYLDLFATSFVRSDRLFMNKGGGRFRDVTKECDLASKGKSITAVFGDLNGDGYPDLYVGRWNAENSLYLNNGDGTFRDITKESGTGRGQFHETNSVLLADFNNDGKLDIFVGDREASNRLFLNEGDGHFRDVSRESGLADSTYTYGSVFGDFENDGRLDVLVVGLGTIRFYRNTGNGRNGVPVFVDETAKFLPGSDYYNGYNTGAATFDVDGNGDLDAIVGQYQGHTMLFKNNLNSVPGKHKNFIEVNIEGDESNRDGIGAKIKLLMNGRMKAYREVMSTYGYASSSSRTQLFGITDPDAKYAIEVNFPESGVKRFVNVLPGSRIGVYEHIGIERDYFLARKNLTGLIMSPRFRTATAESLSLFILVLLLLTVRFPYFGSKKIARGLKAPLAFSAIAMFVFAGIDGGIYLLEQIFFSTGRWIRGSHDLVTEHLLPIFLTLLLTTVLVRVKEKRKSGELLRRAAYGRLYSLLRKFSHGEGPAVVLNRLAFFVDNLNDLIGDSSNQKNEVSVDQSAKGVEVQDANDDPKARFLAVLNEYIENVQGEIENITDAIDVIIGSGIHDQGSGLPRPTAGILKQASGHLLQNVKAMRAKLTRTIETSELDGRIQKETLNNISSIKSSLDDLRKMFDEEFVSEIGRVAADEVGKFRSEYRDFLFGYEDKSAGARGIIGEGELREILLILIRNSIEAISSFGSPENPKTIFVGVHATATSIVIEEEDNGPGVPVESRSLVLSGDFTTKGSGHGFGLRYVLSCLSKYGGEIHLDESRVGAKFVVRIEKAV